MKRTLFNISEDLQALAEILEEVGGEITDEQAEAAIDSFFAELGAERDAKLDGYCAVIKEFEAKQKARAEEASRLNALASVDANSAKRLKTRLHQFLQSQDEKKIETTRFKISRVANGGKLPVILDEYFETNPVELPEQYRIVEFKPNLEKLREDLTGIVSPQSSPEEYEVLAFARLGERGEHLRVK